MPDDLSVSGRQIGDSDAAIALLAPGLDGLPHEELHIALLGTCRRVLGLRKVRGQTAEAVELPLRSLIAEALAHDAEGLILAHNHPGGNSDPSAADLQLTRRLVAVAHPLGLAVLDHLIFAGGAVTSFRALGLL